MKSKNLITVAAIALLAMAFKELTLQPRPWPVPDAAKNKKNPVAADSKSIAAGKTLWNTHCRPCHGTKGLGDGPKASQLNTQPGDFSKSDVQAQTDGSLFYKTSQGRDDMPSYKTKIPDPDDIWNLVNYIRTLKKGGVTAPVIKDTIVKKAEAPPVKKDTIIKKESPAIPKAENISLQEQINTLRTKVAILEKEINLLKERLSAYKIDTASHN